MAREKLTPDEFEAMVQTLDRPVIESDGVNDYLTFRGTTYYAPVVKP